MEALNQADINFVAGQVVSHTVTRDGNALIETIAGSERLNKVAKQYISCSSEIPLGRMFGNLESTKFNDAATKAANTLRTVTTEQLGEQHSAVDILISNPNGDIFKEIQVKSYEDLEIGTEAVVDAKYNGIKNAEEHNIYLKDYASSFTKGQRGQIEYEVYNSKGTSYTQSQNVVERPDELTSDMLRTEFISGAKNAILGGALAGAFLGGTITALQGVYKDDFCVKETGKDAVNNAARRAIISGVSYGFEYLGNNHQVMNGNAVTALASSAVRITELTYLFLNKKISSEEYLKGLGSNAVSCFSGIIMTAAGAALFGPIGAAVSGTIALIGMKQIYKVFTNAQDDLQLAKEARLQAESLSEELIKQIKEEESLLISYYQEYENTFSDLKELVDLAVIDQGLTERAIVSLAEGLNVKFEYETLSEFELFMLSDEELEL